MTFAHSSNFLAQVGMSGGCYPDALIGNIPNLYYYAANNPSEATIAKRRSYANTISYLTPPAENAGLYKGLKELKELIASYQSLRESGRAVAICNTIVETARQCNLDKDVELPEEDAKDLKEDARDLLVGNVYRCVMNKSCISQQKDENFTCRLVLGAVHLLAMMIGFSPASEIS